jgi:hypothetical protein
MLYFAVASIAAFLSALNFGVSLSHLMELNPHPLWAHNAGTSERSGRQQARNPVSVASFPSAILALGFFAYLNIGQAAFHWSLAAILCSAAALATWFALVAPISAEIADSRREPQQQMRDQWEVAHAVITALNLAAFASLIGALLVQRA